MKTESQNSLDCVMHPVSLTNSYLSVEKSDYFLSRQSYRPSGPVALFKTEKVSD